ncbi:cache domain-containing protein [Pseudomonas sp.]|uniref:HAMP domain-containing protein n=1 Tax=Pseudomonas sp. TaxID=306 RepID=UPI003F94F05B
MNKNLKFSHKILLAASLIVLAAFALFTLYNDYLQRNAIRDDLNSYLHEMGGVTANNIQTWLAGRSLLVENLSQSVALNADPANVSNLLEQKAITSTFMGAYLGNKDGSFMIRPDSKMPDGYDPRARPWYKSAENSSGSALTEPYIDLASGQLVISIVNTVRKAGQSVGVVGGDLSLQAIADSLNALSFDGNGYAFLVSADGKILVHPDKALVMKNLSDVYPQDTPRIGNEISETVANGKTRIVAFAPIKGLSSVSWYVGVSVDKDKAFAMLSNFRSSAVIATTIAVLIIIALLGLLIRALMQPLHVMTRAMQDIADGEGDLTRRLTIESQDEFGILGTAFNRFVERIHTSISEVSSATSRSMKWPCGWSAPRTRRCSTPMNRPVAPTVSPRPSTSWAPRPRNSPAMPPRPRTRPATPAAWPKTVSRWWSAASRPCTSCRKCSPLPAPTSNR